MIPAGLVLGATGMALIGMTVRGGVTPGGPFWVGLLFFGFGFGSAFSPLMTLALAHVPPADAADASGMLATMTQLAQVVGVATFGTLYLSLVPGTPSGRALALTCVGLSGVTLLGALSVALLPRTAQVSPVP
jgi:hypothetical protein